MKGIIWAATFSALAAVTTWVQEAQCEPLSQKATRPNTGSPQASASTEQVYEDASNEQRREGEAESVRKVMAAQRLYDLGVELMGSGHFGSAAQVLEDSNRLDPAVGTQYRLAECYEKIGRLALAWSLFTAVAEASRAGGSTEREKLARSRALTIDPWIASMIIRISPDVRSIQGAQLTVDGRELEKNTWARGTTGTFPVDIGEHIVEVTAGGKSVYRQVVAVQNSGSLVQVDIPEKVEVEDMPIAAQRSRLRIPPPAQTKESNAPPVATILLGIGGSLACGVGGVGLLVRSNDNTSVGTPLAVAGFLSGATMLGTSAALWLTAEGSHKSASASRMQFVPVVGPTGMFGVLRGQF